MRIALVCQGMVPPKEYGGTERVVHWLAKALAAMGHEVALLASGFSNEAAAGLTGVQCVPVAFPAGNINELAFDPLPLLPFAPDILHLHFASPMRFSVPVLKTVHGYPFHYTGREEWASPDEFGPEYSFVSRAHATVCGWPQGDVVYNGVDVNDYTFRADHDGYLLFLGKVGWNVKGLPLAVKIARTLHMPLKVAGSLLTPEYAAELESLCTGCVEYVGPVGGAKKRALLAGAKALLNTTSWPEPFGLVTVEALASGTPVLSSANGALPEVMKQGVTGFMCNSVQETIAAYEQLGQIDPHACRTHVETNFSSRVMAENYLRLYLKRIRQFAMGQL